ncbi:DMT family transporter [Phenylobacterium sp. LjRoot225]|uniref:DMT family transporter n=1 Tax=Phenylobacterium sp. LjRoot225 TaxID=3342285 RepID=UPI003ECC3AAD
MVAYAMLALVMLLWAGNSIVGRAVRDQVPPFTFALLRWTGAFLVLAPFVLRRAIAERAEILRAWRPILLLGLIGVAGFNAFLYSGLRHTTATNALLMQAAIPAVVLAADFLLFRARPRGLEVIGVLFSMAGVALIVLRGDIAAIGDARLNSGDLLVLAGVVCWATYTSLLRRRPALHPLNFLLATFAVGIVAMAPLAAGEWSEARHIVWTAPVVLAVAYVAILPSVVAYALFNAAVAQLGAGPAGQAINLLPVFGAGIAAATLGEPLHPYHLAGMALVLTGIAVPAVLAGRR